MGQDLLALRDYQPLDDLRRVDWKATARTRRLIVREFSAEDDRRVTVFFNTRLTGEMPEKPMTLRERIEAEQSSRALSPISQRFEKAVGQTASLLAHFTEQQAEIRLIVHDEIGEFGIGKQHLSASLKRLALIEPSYDEAAKIYLQTLEEITSEAENSYTFFITADATGNLSEELLRRAKVLQF
jgi:uncharacterized protein (DUF58 family)